MLVCCLGLFLDFYASRITCQRNGACIDIENSPEVLKESLINLLKEKSFNRVIVDDMSSIGGVKDFEKLLVVQQLSKGIRGNDAQGMFIRKVERLNHKSISDIAMIVDNTKRE